MSHRQWDQDVVADVHVVVQRIVLEDHRDVSLVERVLGPVLAAD
jgi:hypothetical protein